jgi:hypothetical protein
MQIACWNGELVELAFALDCCDREAISYVAEARPLLNTDIRRLMRQAAFARFGNERPTDRLEWLSDNGAVYTAPETVIEAEKLGLTQITTPVASPESNGMSEAFVNTVRRDYLDGADRASAAILLSQVSGWITDYKENAPHSALGYRSPVDFRGQQRLTAVSGCLTKQGSEQLSEGSKPSCETRSRITCRPFQFRRTKTADAHLVALWWPLQLPLLAPHDHPRLPTKSPKPLPALGRKTLRQ